MNFDDEVLYAPSEEQLGRSEVVLYDGARWARAEVEGTVFDAFGPRGSTFV